MKRFVFLASITFAAPGFMIQSAAAESPVGSHEGGPHEGRGARRVEMLKEQLNLSDEQAQKIRAIFQARRGKCAAVLEPDGIQQCRRENFQTGRKEVEAILSPEQLQKFKTLREERKGRWEEHREKAGLGERRRDPSDRL